MPTWEVMWRVARWLAVRFGRVPILAGEHGLCVMVSTVCESGAVQCKGDVVVKGSVIVYTYLIVFV